MDLFRSLYEAEQAHKLTSDLQGRSFGISFAIVADNRDPLSLGRVKVMLPSKGAKTMTDWLVRLSPSKLISVPLVDVGDTVAVSFVNGDPNNGCYLGIINNVPQPPAKEPKNTLSINGDTYVVQTPKDISLVAGSSSFKLSTNGSLEISGVSSVTVNGKPVMLVGGKDSDRDVMVESGI